MRYSKLFAVLTAVVASMGAGTGACYAQPTTAAAASFESSLEGATGDTLNPILSTILLSPEELIEQALQVEHIPYEPNDVIQDRISCIESDIPLVFNPFVRSHIDYFTVRNRKYTRKMITRQNVYFPLFEKYLKKYNMPQDMKYLSIVESGLNPKAASWAGAVGLWQFIKTTGKEHGLDQTQFIDERMDPEKATDAACRFLSRLYRNYGDWELAMAAYNCGPGNVNKAIRKAGGGKKTFWEIFPYLPKETRSYVPNMTAVIYTMNYAAEHNIFSDSILYAPEYETLLVNHALDLERLAEELHVAPTALLALNPEIKQKMLPENTRNYKLRIPAQRAALLASTQDLDCILASAKPLPVSEPVKEIAPLPQNPIMLAGIAPAVVSEKPDTLEKKVYKVQRGDNLSVIAKKHNVTVTDIREWNNLKGATIQANQQLIVMQPVAAETPDQSALLASAAEPTAKAEAVAAKPVTKKTAAPKAPKELIHHVQPGDTLWNISLKYNGISVEQIKKLNKLRTNDIKPGQKLIIS